MALLAGLPHHGVTGQFNLDQMVNKIEQSETKIVITNGFMDVVRTIRLDGEFSSEIVPSVTGYSVGEWDGDTLVVKIKSFAPGFLQAPGGHPGPATRHGDHRMIQYGQGRHRIDP